MLAKIRLVHFLEAKLQKLEKHKKSIVLRGDLNIARNNKKVFNPVYAENSAGFTLGELWVESIDRKRLLPCVSSPPPGIKFVLLVELHGQG